MTRTERSERGHAVLLMLGVVSTGYAWILGWHGWALYLTAGNVLVNAYPILLQRYTRSRLHSIVHRSALARGGLGPSGAKGRDDEATRS